MSASSARRSAVRPLSIGLLALVGLSVAVTLYLEAVLPPTVPAVAAVSLLAARPLLGTLLVFAFVGFAIVRGQERNAVGWILFAAAVSFTLSQLSLAYVTSAEYSPAGAYSIPGVVGLVGNAGFAIAVWLTFGLLPSLFPDGRPLSSRWAWVVRFGAAATVVWQATRAVDPGAVGGSPDAVTPVGNPLGNAAAAALLLPFSHLAVLAVLATMIPGILSVALRYRRGTTETKLQLRWFLAACVAMLLVTALLVLAGPLQLPELAVFTALAAGYALAPIAIGLAILRYRLYDIDVLINRALVYGATTAGIATAFFAGIVVLQALLRPLTSGSEVAVAASTLACFALFQPLRRRMQGAVDRRFYRSRYDAARTLDEFSVRLRDQVALAAVRADLLAAVRDTVQPAHASVWLREDRR